MTYDFIIIGGGLGGLTAGAKLAKEGKKVLLLEQHDRPGGCATTFKRKEFTMEVGLHDMEGLYPRDNKMKMFEDLGLLDRINFLELPEFYRFINGRQDIVIPHQVEDAKVVLKKAFPGEEEGIDAYFWHLANAKRVMVLNRNQPEKNIGLFLDEIITNEELSDINCKVLIVLGDRDVVKLEHGMEMYRNIPGSLFCVLPDTPHEVFSKNPELINKIGIEFLLK